MRRASLAGLLCLLPLLLAGCALPGKPPVAVSYYVLTDPGPIERSPVIHPGTLLLREMEAPPFYQDTALAFSRAPGTRGQYQYARWSEPVARRLSWMLRQRLESAGVFQAVAPLGSGVYGDFQLNTRLVDFYHDATHAPGVALMLLEAELVRRADAGLVARRIFVTQVPAQSYDATGAADALGQAANQVMDELIAWLARIRTGDAR
ncbi:MAG TPA: ABC-type transport auxiliary lipoprotein family protein [Thiobacillaceae bacterium]|nr:ABC-type transport auxiliary lipoprotein family protein [Thiobacillaceae bacterium]HNU63847.1 ABC-type transport auxiliary lipoprotein family protein [Thiobacillaceae bacterium]